MSLHDVTINLSGLNASVIIDGKDVTKGVRDLTLTWSPGRPGRLALDVDLYDVTTLGSTSTEVLVDDASAELLTTVGWTPPPT